MKKKYLSPILDEHIEIFLNNIGYELENRHTRWFEGFGFPLFGETSKNYHEQVYFE